MPRKGGDFERELCRTLSLWFSGGKRDDLLWRSSQSGGRATARARKGQTTAGHCGDICATCPAGEPLTAAVTWEAKRGYGGKKGKTARASLTQLLTATAATWKSPPKESLPGFIHQAREAKRRAGTKHWALVWKPDNMKAMIFMPEDLFDWLILGDKPCPYMICWPPDHSKVVIIAALLLDDFLKYAKPKHLKQLTGGKNG